MKLLDSKGILLVTLITYETVTGKLCLYPQIALMILTLKTTFYLWKVKLKEKRNPQHFLWKPTPNLLWLNNPEHSRGQSSVLLAEVRRSRESRRWAERKLSCLPGYFKNISSSIRGEVKANRVLTQILSILRSTLGGKESALFCFCILTYLKSDYILQLMACLSLVNSIFLS